MVYLVTNQMELFESDEYKTITPDESLKILDPCPVLQYDSETTGIDAHLDKILCIQFGNDEHDFRMVIDCGSVDILIYKNIFETKGIIGHNLKFDLQFLYNYGIVPRTVYDTMITEQFLFLGYPSFMKSYSLKSVAKDRLGVDIDKTIRGQIIWRGLDTATIMYSAGDVTYLEKILSSQLQDINARHCIQGAMLENQFTPVIAYLEWCGIKLDEGKWKAKMDNDQKALEEATDKLNEWAIQAAGGLCPMLKKYIVRNTQGDLFTGWDLTPKCTLNWSSSRQVIQVAKALGFNTTVQDKKTGADKDSVLEKHLKGQKGICDEFLDLYFTRQEKFKVCSTYGQSYLDAINPATGRIHSVFRAIGASSSRMACGSDQQNASLAKAKNISIKRAINGVQLQNLPADEATRSAFVAEAGNLLVDCDFSA